jgi:cyclophilin family peptidyl-prolyl cis-trans isomerase
MMTRHISRLWPAGIALAAVLIFALTIAGPASAQDTAQKKTTQKKSEEAPVQVVLKTNQGDITLELDKAKAPVSVNNFLAYAEEGYYDSTIFHRVIPDFMIQGGGFTADMTQKKTSDPIKNEWQNGLKNVRGSIAMARLGGQANSATSQFFINVKDNTFLDQPRDGAGYAVFGKVVKGMDVVDKIQHVKTAKKGMYADVPVDPVVIEKVEILNEKPAEKPTEGEKNK